MEIDRRIVDAIHDSESTATPASLSTTARKNYVPGSKNRPLSTLLVPAFLVIVIRMLPLTA
jgi:hypothetical protein